MGTDQAPERENVLISPPVLFEWGRACIQRGCGCQQGYVALMEINLVGKSMSLTGGPREVPRSSTHPLRTMHFIPGRSFHVSLLAYFYSLW